MDEDNRQYPDLSGIKIVLKIQKIIVGFEFSIFIKGLSEGSI